MSNKPKSPTQATQREKPWLEHVPETMREMLRYVKEGCSTPDEGGGGRAAKDIQIMVNAIKELADVEMGAILLDRRINGEPAPTTGEVVPLKSVPKASNDDDT